MCYELLIYWFFTILISSLSIIILCTTSKYRRINRSIVLYTANAKQPLKNAIQQGFTILQTPLILPEVKQPLMITGITSNYDYADDVISDLECKKYKNEYGNIESVRYYDLSYLRDYLAYHLVKYPNGILPKQSGSISYYDSKFQCTMNFYDCTESKIEKYIKESMRLLKVKKSKVKQLDILKEANKIVRKRSKTVKKTVKNKIKVEV